MERVLRIGTRDSELALWQANTVKSKLEHLGYEVELIPTKSLGDIDLVNPLYEMGVTGVFTKTLDVALLNRSIDIAVHSMKDVPTLLPRGIAAAAVLKRANFKDVLLYKGDLDFLERKAVVATGSLRRKAQWLHRYPEHQIENLRGNVNSRLQKLQENTWDAAIFAMAGLERIQKVPSQHWVLDWMLPAPAQGAILVVTHQSDDFSFQACQKLNDADTAAETFIEREFLRTLEGGCSAPIGAHASISENKIHFKGGIFSLDGKQSLQIEREAPVALHKQAGSLWAEELISQGADLILKDIRQDKK